MGGLSYYSWKRKAEREREGEIYITSSSYIEANRFQVLEW